MEYDSAAWMKYRRMHEANIFNAFFYDNENVVDEDINVIISDVARFFDLPIPVVSSKCQEMAKIVIDNDAYKTEIMYNMEMLQNAGIKNKDAFTLCFVHEMAHQLLYTEPFNLFRNERWLQELAADLTAGVYSTINSVSTAKFKYALSIQKACLTHPAGKLRAAIVEYGRTEMVINFDNNVNIITKVRNLIPTFYYLNSRQLKADLKQVEHDIEFPPEPVPKKEINIEDLPESNLLKQALLKYKK